MNKHEITNSETTDFSSLQIERIEFVNERYRRVAELLEKLSILEPMLLSGRRLLETAGLEPDSDNEKQIIIAALKKELHDLLLIENTYDQGPRLTLTASDVEPNNSHGWMLNQFKFRDSDANNLAYQIGMVASFQHELEGHMTNRYRMDESERKAMIKDTVRHLHENIDHLMKILTGFYKK